MKFSALLILFSVLTTFQCTQPVTPEKHPGIFITGKVLDKDGKPVANVTARLVEQGVEDITGSDGVYTIIDSAFQPAPGKRSAGAVDSVKLLRDGQVITSMEVTGWIDTLPDVFIVQRDIYGTFSSGPGSVGFVTALISGGAIPSGSPLSADLWYNTANNSFSGFVYFVYTGSVLEYSVRVDVFSTDSILTGRSVTVDFPSTAGDINIPGFSPVNALPEIRALVTAKVSIGDNVQLTGSASLLEGVQIVSWEWSINNGPFFAVSSPDTAIVAPAEPVSSYVCILRGTDSNGNTGTDEKTITVVADIPQADIGRDTALFCGDTLLLHGHAAQLFGSITQWEWDFGGRGVFVRSASADTQFIIPDIPDTGMTCILRVTDDDGNTGYDTMRIHLCSTGEKWEKVNSDITIPQKARFQVFENRLFLFDRDATSGANAVWSSEDGFSWTKVTDSAEFSPLRNFATASFNGKLWVMRGESDTIEWNTSLWNSTDGASWEKAGNAEVIGGRYSPATSVVFADQLWLFAPESSPAGIWRSADGLVWEAVDYTPGFSMNDFETAAIFQDSLWLFGPKGMAWKSSDGITFTMVEIKAANAPPDALSPFFRHVGLALEDKVIVLNSKGIFSSSDGTMWNFAEYRGSFPTVNSDRYSFIWFKGKIWGAGEGELWYCP